MRDRWLLTESRTIRKSLLAFGFFMTELSIDRFVELYARRTSGMGASEVRALFAVASRPEVASLAGGMPFVQALPAEDVLEVVRALLDEHGSTSLQYGGGQGHLSLRTRLSMLMAAEGVAGDPEDMIVTSGAQQALDLIGKIFLDAGDLIAVEAPAYVGALTAFGAYEPRYLQIDVDDDGMVVDQLEESLVRGDRPKLVYTCPNFGNPTGMTLSYGRREQLVVLCREAGIPIVEDNPYGMLRFEGDQLPALRTLDPDNVIYLGTVSKVFSPGVRVGWALAGQSAVQRLVLAKEAADLCGSTFTMRHRAVLRRRGPLENQPRDAERDLPITTRRDARGHRGALSTRGVLQPPRGRLLCVGDLPDWVDTRAMLAAAVERRSHTFPGPRSTPTAAGATRCGSPSAIHRPSASVRASRLGTLLGDEQATYRSLRP